MPKLKVLGSSDLLAIFTRLGFTVTAQKGSHIKLSRITPLEKQILVVPNHKELAKGTIKAILNQAGRYLSHEELMQHFYTE